MDKIKIIIPERMKGERIDVAISKMLPDVSRSKIHTAIKLGDTVINGKKFKAKDKSNGSEVVSFTIQKNINNQWIAEKIPLNIIYEDEDIIIIDKQSGLVTHPGPGNWSGTLANALLYYDQNLAKIDRAGIVHRLDKNTSGLMVVAKNLKSQKYLTDQLQAHSIYREYSAIVYGYMISGGSIDKPIGRDPKDRVKQAIINNGKEALTHYRLIDRFKNHTHVKAILETGRTHQIRVHLSHIGHPLIGDSTYGGRVRYPKKASQELKESLKNFERHALHSKKITLVHPISGEVMSWKSSLPVDMTKLLKVLKEFDNC